MCDKMISLWAQIRTGEENGAGKCRGKKTKKRHLCELFSIYPPKEQY